MDNRGILVGDSGLIGIKFDNLSEREVACLIGGILAYTVDLSKESKVSVVINSHLSRCNNKGDESID